MKEIQETTEYSLEESSPLLPTGRQLSRFQLAKATELALSTCSSLIALGFLISASFRSLSDPIYRQDKLASQSALGCFTADDSRSIRPLALIGMSVMISAYILAFMVAFEQTGDEEGIRLCYGAAGVILVTLEVIDVLSIVYGKDQSPQRKIEGLVEEEGGS